MKKNVLFAAALVLSLGQTASAATFTILFEDDFDSTPNSLNASLAHWNVTEGSVDVIGDRPTASYDFYPGNGNYVDMDGSTGDAGRITTKQVFDFVVGTAYRLYFTMGKNGGGFETLNFGFDFLANSITNEGSIPTMVDQYVDFTVASNVSSAIYFEGTGGDYHGMIVDNVILKTLNPSVVPLPATLPLVLLGLGGLVSLRRRKNV